MNVTVAPGAKVDQMPLLAVVSGEAPAPKGPGVVKVSLVMPPAPKGTSVAGEPCMSVGLIFVMVTLPVLEIT